MSATPQHSSGPEGIAEQLARIEARLARIEQYLELVPTVPTMVTPGSVAGEGGVAADESFEIELGQNWFAKLGILVLALGVVFLLTLPFPNQPGWLPSVAGYLLAGGVVGAAGVSRKSYPQISRYLLGGALLLFYFATLRLAFFGAVPAVASRGWLTVLLLGAGLVNLVVAARRGSPYLVVSHLSLGCVTALVSGSPWPTLAILLAVCLAAVGFERRFRWGILPVAGIVLALIGHTIWALGNPLLGNPLRVVAGPEANLGFLLAYVAIVAGAGVVRPREGREGETAAEMATTVLSGGGSYLILLFLTLTVFKAHFVAWNLAASALYLGCATLLWKVRGSQFSTFVYAMLGYAAMSAAIVDGVAMPGAFAWLCWESMVVVSTAVWFRSRFIVVANFVIFLGIFAGYLLTAGEVTLVSMGFGLVALATARILNWQRDRLVLKTELMRNAYLAAALFVIPYSVYHAVPRGLVSISWLGIAAVYFVASRVLKNAKYRWMALATMSITVLWVFLVDLVALSPMLRILSFLVLGSVLLVISMVYSRRRVRPSTGGLHPDDEPLPKG